MNEAETRIRNIDPLLEEYGWNDSNNPDAPFFVREHSFTDGKIRGERVRGKAKRADYLLFYRQPQFPIAVVEAKADYKLPSDGIQQAKTYAEMLGLSFAYSTNGKLFVEFDFITGLEVKTLQNASAIRTIVAYLNDFQRQIQEKVNRIKGFQAQTTHELDGILPSVFDKIFRRNG